MVAGPGVFAPDRAPEAQNPAMSVVNLRDKTINAKVVYYGPPLGGKTTSLKWIHRVMDPERRTNLISLNTDRDRTLFFDFLPIGLGRIGDFTLKIQGFTVPGQVKYLLTRRYVLRGADAVVFVADSRVAEGAHNLASLKDLRENLAVNGLDYAAIPLVLEYNKRDEEPVAPVEAMDRDLNDRGVPRFETVATVGTGVFEAFAAVTTAMVERICTEYRIAGGKDVAAAVGASLGRIHASFLAAAPRAAPARAPGREGSSVVVLEERPGGAEDGTDLLERALASNMRVAELLTQVQEARAEVESRMAELQALYRVGSAAAATLDEDRVVATVVEGAAAALGVEHASILVRDEEDGSLRERGVHGFLYDPLVAGGAGADGRPPVLDLLASPDPVLVTAAGPPGVLDSIRAREPSVHAAVAAPLRVRDEARGLLVVYVARADREPGESEVRFLGTLAASASVALENARLHGALERFNRELEAKVAERTADLERALRELQQLDRLKEDFLSSMSHELMTPLAGVRSSAEILRTYPDMDPAERGEFLQGIEQEARRLTDRLQDILDLSALDAGRVKLSRTPVAPREFVQQALDRAGPAFRARGVKAGFWPQSALPKVLLDPRWADKALDHVLGNAAKFSPPKGEVDVTVERDGGGVRITVRDRGPGIPPEERESLFRRFKQIGQVLTDKTPGIGAGLPLARRILDLHGGSIALEGGPGKGTIVILRFPAS
jgi:signal transduction histidine kinase/signal recognition particle receptor subunit beta